MKKVMVASGLLAVSLLVGCSEMEPEQEVQADDKEKTEQVEKKEEGKKEESKAKKAEEERDKDPEKLAQVNAAFQDSIMFSSGIIHNIEYKGEGIIHVFVDETAWASSTKSEKESFVLVFEKEVEEPLTYYDLRADDEAIHTHYFSAQLGDKVASQKMFGGFDIKR
ncbi:hypothetical protein [Salimicrobium halophilum]|uniref:Uncharacterized protein n=1 Tax=Salimicrobium halophilum TaxID=86666 RepID=A0A1G8W6P2_9BACI|nr:hypothetical protein [Salimicrobium halophilum]SDJ73776.1 hypothetical protein SAMN04490247_3047 [Salimicrobium halophilum]